MTSRFGYAGCNYPYVVLLGPAGSGKSTFVRKLVHPECLSDVDNKRVTKLSCPFWTYDGSMVICDTPGTDSEVDRFRHNYVHIAAALTFSPVSRILIVVKADIQMYSVLDTIRMYLNNLLKVTYNDEKGVGVLVTNKDTVSNWHPEELISLAKKRLGLNCVIFSGADTSKEALLEEIKKSCLRTVRVTQSSINYLFRIFLQNSYSKIKIICDMKVSVQGFKTIKRQFDEIRIRKKYDGQELIFEFKTWMEDKIGLAVNKLADSNGFTFHGEQAEIEEGLITTMKSQIRLILYDLQIDIAKSLVEREVDARRCPYCNEVWTKDYMERCDGYNICGDKPSAAIDVVEKIVNELATYTFKWYWYTENLIITKTDISAKRTKLNSFGCGKSIVWQNMPQVELSVELSKSLTIPDPETKPIHEESTVHVPIKRLKSRSDNWNTHEKYVVMIGDVGVGKSTVVDKLTDTKVQKSDCALSVTRYSKPYWTYDSSMVVCDTPGSNSIQDQLEHNELIASALNYKPVSRILIIVKADTRIANVMSVIDRYSERLLSLPEDIVGVLVTHMDTVSWTPEDLKPRIKEEFDMDCVLFNSKHTSRETLLEEIKAVCSKPESVKVDDNNFSQLFKINNRMVKILRETTKEVGEIKEMKKQFDRHTNDYDSKTKPAIVLQFLPWIENKIAEAEKRFITSNNFTFKGKDDAKEKGYIASMTSQMRVFLHDLSDEADCHSEQQVGADLERVTFAWNKRKLSVRFPDTKGTKGKASSSERSSKAINKMDTIKPQKSDNFNKPSDCETTYYPRTALIPTSSAKKQSLPLIECYKAKRKESQNTFDGVRCQFGSVNTDIDRRSHLTISKNEASGTGNFSFNVENQDSNAEMEDKSDLSTKMKNLQVKERNSELDGDELDKRPHFSFELCVKDDHQRIYNYTLMWQNGDLKIEVPGQRETKTIRSEIKKNDESLKEHRVGDRILPPVDWPPEPWRNLSVSIDEIPSEDPECENMGSWNSGTANANQLNQKQPFNSTERLCRGRGIGKKHETTRRHTDAKNPKSAKDTKRKGSFLYRFTNNKSKIKRLEYPPEEYDFDHEANTFTSGITEEEKSKRKSHHCSLNVDNRSPDTGTPKFRITINPSGSSNEQINDTEHLYSNNLRDRRNKTFPTVTSADLNADSKRTKLDRPTIRSTRL